jgi:diguanylate cyclase (GGDEF)-like protein
MSFAIWPVCFAEADLDALKLSSVQQIETRLQNSPRIEIQPVTQDITDTLGSLKQGNYHNADIKIRQLLVNYRLFNAAEQYLLLIAQALLAHTVSENIPKSELIIKLLEQAKLLENKISKEQLSQPDFLQLHLLLAEHYANVFTFDLAYLEKKLYLKKYYLHRKNKRADTIAAVEQAFAVDNKKATNALLFSQNKIKQQRLAEVKKEQKNRQYNLPLISLTVFIIALLFFRQLKNQKKLRVLSKTDSLTGLSNRSALFEQGKHMIAALAVKSSGLSVLLLNVDHFKKINDSFGHDIGDQVLIKISELVKETMRSRDVLSRLGDEEFVALLPFADANKAKAIAMRINEKVAQYNFSSLMLQSKVTVSIGVATVENKNISFDDVLQTTDLAMHQAKEHGRNAVFSYQNIIISE